MVAVLLGVCGPSAVARRIVTLSIRPPINLHSWRTLAHIGKEVFKRHPSRTHVDTFATVVAEHRALSVRASLNHRDPTRISSAALTLNGMTMLKLCTSRKLLAKAPARGCSSRNQVGIVGHEICPAVAVDMASPLISSGRRFRKHESPSKSLTDDVSFSWHNGYRVTVVASGGRPASTGAHCDYAMFNLTVN